MEIKFGKWLYCGIICCLLICFASSGNCQVQSREWKLMISPVVFSEDREAGYQLIQKRIADTVASLKITTNFIEHKEKCRLIRYYDTANRDLSRQDYILRERVRIKKGLIQDNGDLTLKLRLANANSAVEQLFYTAESEDVKVKAEEDTIGFVDNQVGKSQTLLSLSATRQDVPVAEMLSMESVSEYFPLVRIMEIDLPDDLAIIGQTLEYSTVLGSLLYENLDPLAIDITVWYDPLNGNVQIAEISYKYPNMDAAALDKLNQLFMALQENNQDILVAGQTKTAYLTN